jgi:fatty-acyl-CoA synthase
MVLPKEEQRKILQKQGHAIYGVDMKIVNDDGVELPWDGATYGHLLVKGPWIIASYFKNEGGDVLQDGWLPTGDVATIDADGYMQIIDRSKDVIKSGGEWIGTIDLENIAMAHPAVLQAACIGIAHPEWDERPLLLVVKRPGQDVTREELLNFFEGRSPGFGCRTTWRSWTPCRWARPARSRRTSCASSSATTSCRPGLGSDPAGADPGLTPLPKKIIRPYYYRI